MSINLKESHRSKGRQSVTYTGTFAHCEIEVLITYYDTWNKTAIYADGEHVSTVDNHEIAGSNQSLESYVEDVLINANIGR